LENFVGGALRRILFTTTMLSVGFVLGSEGAEGSGLGAVCVRKMVRLAWRKF